ncbi:MAG TPA: glycosyltransferase [Sphingomicrobium sp.]|nr:glycosyltransferase [Sphingomicrobium sp.]
MLCPYPIGVAAGQRLKFEQYYDDWRRHGWDVEVSPYMDLALWSVAFSHGAWAAKIFGTLKGYWRRILDLLRLRRFDLIYCFMYATPIGPGAAERMVRFLSRKLVFDVEDNVLIGQNLERKDNPNWLLGLLRGRAKAEQLIRTADHVITSSPALNARCLEINRARACTYISSSLDPERFVPASRPRGDGKVTIGWTGTFSSRPYLDLLQPVFRRLAEKRDFRLRVIGNFDYALPGVDLDLVCWTADREVEDLQAIDIGVYPLPLDEWVSGKSGLKAIQYMMMGIPCVATDVGTTPLIIRDGENGLLVRTEDEWVEALERLIDDPRLRVRLGQQARLDAVANYSTNAIAAEYRKVLDQVVSEPSR